MTFIILMAFADPSMEIVGALYLANKSTANLIIYITILTTLMVILTAFFDWRITVTNSRIQELRLTDSKNFIKVFLVQIFR